MKVDKNQPTSAVYSPDTGLIPSGIPLRLEIAARILAAQWASTLTMVSPYEALEQADALIQAHNETCEEKE